MILKGILWQVWFLGENANYAASEYAWESATPPGTALMMLDADKMVAAASSRNPTLAGALTRLQRCAFSGSWEVYDYILLVVYFDLVFDWAICDRSRAQSNPTK